MSVEQAITSIFETFGIEENFTPESLLSDLGFDSIMILELVVTLEEQFDFIFDDDDLLGYNFQTVSSIMDLLKKYLPRE